MRPVVVHRGFVGDGTRHRGAPFAGRVVGEAATTRPGGIVVAACATRVIESHEKKLCARQWFRKPGDEIDAGNFFLSPHREIVFLISVQRGYGLDRRDDAAP